MEKSNQERLEEYLVGNDGYLKEKLSNGKVIMLSGKWGSGKTHFWQNRIQTILNEKDKKIPNHYISLYGKTSIQEIKNEVFLKIFESVDSSKLEEKGTKLAKNIVDLVSSFIKSVDINGVKIDLSTVSDNSFEHIENFLENKKLKKTVEYLNSGAIICFDDFERKSKDIDLNDLFGFITQLTLNFDCKVVIILNDDVFEGEEKNVFSRVKEKSVSKFLKYEPSIRDLFKSIIFEKDNSNNFKYSKLKKYLKIILKTIEKTQELNARIYIQVLDNLVEWIISETAQFKSDMYIYYFIKLNINFIINHNVIKLEFKENKFNISSKSFKNQEILIIIESLKIVDDYQKDFNIKILGVESKILSEEEIRSIYFNVKLHCCYFKEMDMKIINKINNFIETGILINE